MIRYEDMKAGTAAVLAASAEIESSRMEGNHKLNTDSVACAAPRLRKAKRTLDFDSLFTLLAAVLASSPVLLAALLRPKTSAALREKVMLGATSVTDCRYCAWGHDH